MTSRINKFRRPHVIILSVMNHLHAVLTKITLTHTNHQVRQPKIHLIPTPDQKEHHTQQQLKEEVVDQEVVMDIFIQMKEHHQVVQVDTVTAHLCLEEHQVAPTTDITHTVSRFL